MKKNNIIIILLVVVIIVETGYVFYLKQKSSSASMQMTNMPKQNASSRPRPMFVIKGQKFSDNPLFSKAYLVFPTNGDLSTNAKKALTGWDMTTTASADGTTQVTLTPHEAEDVKQSFTVKSGYKLYFIEMTLVDDQQGVDENRGDDIGVLVDQNGTVE